MRRQRDRCRGCSTRWLPDAIQDALSWQVTSETGWQSEEFLGRDLNAMVVLAPAGRLTVVGTPYVGKPLRRTDTPAPRTFTALRAERGLCRWRCEETAWPW